MTFTFPLSTAALLYKHNIRMVNLGNNHIENFGTSGVYSTIAALTNARVDYFGLPRLASASSASWRDGSGKAGDPITFRMATTTINGVPLAFINYNEFGGASTITIREIHTARAAGESLLSTRTGDRVCKRIAAIRADPRPPVYRRRGRGRDRLAPACGRRPRDL